MTRTNLILLVGVLVIGILSLSLYTINETDRAIVLRFNKILTDSNDEPIVYNAGLHVKFPLMDQVVRFDERLTTFDIKESRITTAEKKDVLVDYYVLWKIEDFVKYFKSTQGFKSKAEALLQQRANSTIKVEFGQLTIKEVVSGERIRMMERLRTITDEKVNDLGITVIDMRVKKVNFPSEVSDSIHKRMRAERERIANSFRAEGEKQAITIRAEADKRRRILLAEAERQVRQTYGEGDAEAFAIYSKTYNKAPEFYEFYRTIDAYKNSFSNKQDILVLKPDGDFFKYFNSMEK